jgi:hypothetical protein
MADSQPTRKVDDGTQGITATDTPAPPWGTPRAAAPNAPIGTNGPTQTTGPVTSGGNDVKTHRPRRQPAYTRWHRPPRTPRPQWHLGLGLGPRLQPDWLRPTAERRR